MSNLEIIIAKECQPRSKHSRQDQAAFADDFLEGEPKNRL
jgi:hypothetical protein